MAGLSLRWDDGRGLDLKEVRHGLRGVRLAVAEHLIDKRWNTYLQKNLTKVAMLRYLRQFDENGENLVSVSLNSSAYAPSASSATLIVKLSFPMCPF